MKSFCDVEYSSIGHEAQRLDIHLPDNGDRFPVFVYFHGGGLQNGDKMSEHLFACAKTLTANGIAFVSANYRMFPEAKYPDFIVDSAEATAWVINNIKKYCTPNGIFVGGSSAGGYLSMMLCFDKRWLSSFGVSPLDITGYVHDAGQPTSHFNVLKFDGMDQRRVIIDERAPLYHIGVDEKYSPMLFIVSDNDRINRYEQTMLTISTLKHFGHEEPDVLLKVTPGRHCESVKTIFENGESAFGRIVVDYINGFSKT